MPNVIDVIKYIRRNDRAVTVQEVSDSTDNDIDKTEDVLETLDRNQYLTSDVVHGEDLSTTVRYFPTDRIHNHSTDKIVDNIY